MLSLFLSCLALQEHAFESSQKYKEGKFIIELAHMIKDNGWDWGTSTRDMTDRNSGGGVQMDRGGGAGGERVWWVSVWLWFGWFTINLCNSLPIPPYHGSWCIHTHTCTRTRTRTRTRTHTHTCIHADIHTSRSQTSQLDRLGRLVCS